MASSTNEASLRKDPILINIDASQQQSQGTQSALVAPIKTEAAAAEARCWEKAVEVITLIRTKKLDSLLFQIFNFTLTRDDKKRIDTKTMGEHPTSSLKTLLESATQAKEASDASGSTFRKKAEHFVTVFHDYATCVDAMIQQSPEITSVVWGSIRFLMGVG